MATSVNRPVNKEKKEADVNRKLQIYGIISAFQQGKIPSNDQVDVALNSFLESKALKTPSNKLSEEGRQLVQDTKNVVEEAKKLLLSKNQGNLLQDFIWQTSRYDYKSIQGPNAPVGKDDAKRDGDEALRGVKTLGSLLITNGQFRKLLQDFTTLLRDMSGDAASNAANKVRPSEDALANMDRPADDNVWHEKPDLSKDKLRKQAQQMYGGKPKEDAKHAANAAANAQKTHGDSRAAEQAARDVVDEKKNQNTDEETRREAEERKEKAKQKKEEYRHKAKEYFNKKMPEERKDQVIFRLKKMILECQQHPDYSEAVQTILRLAENYGRHGRVLGQGGADTAKQTRTGFAQAEDDLRTLIERFANGTSTSDLWSSINQIYKDAEKDEELRNWFKSLNRYIHRCLLEQGYILDEDSSHQWDRLYDQGKYLLRDKYRVHTNRVLNEIKFVGEQFDKDPRNKAFGDAVTKLFLHLGNDANGKPTFKPHLLKDLSEVIIPAVFENVAYIPVPRIEYSDPQFDAIIENLILESDNFAPNIFEIASDNYFRWGRKKIANKHKNTIEVKVAGVQMDLRDVSYHIKRKQGFPSITDTGVVDLILPGEGFSFKVKMSSADKSDRQNFFKVEKVDVDFKGINLKVTQSKHKLLFKLFKPIALKAMRPALHKAIEKAIKDQCNELDIFLYQVKQEADKAQEEFKNNPEQAPNMYKRYADAFQKRMRQGKKKAEDVAQDKKVNVAMTQEDSIFPNIHLPGGISSKATEYKELAKKGDKWESPVFSIGSAKKSDNIPAAPKIERKPHDATPRRQAEGAGLAGAGAGAGAAAGAHAGAGTGAGTGTGYGAPSTGTSTGTGYGAPIAGHNTGTQGPGLAPPLDSMGGAGNGFAAPESHGQSMSQGSYANGGANGATNGGLNGKGPLHGNLPAGVQPAGSVAPGNTV